MKQIKLLCQLQVLPFQPNGPDGPDAEGKQFVFTDTDTGETIIYPMSEQFAKTVAGKMKMKNKMLQDQVEQEQQAAIARDTIIGGDGAGQPPPSILGPGGTPLG